MGIVSTPVIAVGNVIQDPSNAGNWSNLIGTAIIYSQLVKGRLAESVTEAKVNPPLPKSYIKGRISFKKGLIDEVWESNKKGNSKVYNPQTKQEIIWDQSKPRRGQWDMGHKSGKEYWRLVEKYVKGEINLKTFLDEYNNPNNYRPELIRPNRKNNQKN